jgi:hypothetical protein
MVWDAQTVFAHWMTQQRHMSWFLVFPVCDIGLNLSHWYAGQWSSSLPVIRIPLLKYYRNCTEFIRTKKLMENDMVEQQCSLWSVIQAWTTPPPFWVHDPTRHVPELEILGTLAICHVHQHLPTNFRAAVPLSGAVQVLGECTLACLSVRRPAPLERRQCEQTSSLRF